jgi:hypothetical protein
MALRDIHLRMFRSPVPGIIPPMLPTHLSLYNRTSIARQRVCKHAFLTIEALFSAWSALNGYKEVFSSVEQQGIELRLRRSAAGVNQFLRYQFGQ